MELLTAQVVDFRWYWLLSSALMGDCLKLPSNVSSVFAFSTAKNSSLRFNIS